LHWRAAVCSCSLRVCLVLRLVLWLWFKKNCFIKNIFLVEVGLEKYMFG
jgi:hypothetical protein